MINTVNAREADRQNLAALMAAFEEANGPVETLPIVVGDPKPLPYRVSSTKPKATSTRRVIDGPGKGSHSRFMREANIERVRPYLDSGMTYTEIGKRLDLTGATVSSIFKELKGEHNL